MTRTRITFTNDVSEPGVITFGGTPLVKWYAYKREDNSLYMQREQDGILGDEVKVVDTVNKIAVSQDATDATKAYVYFVTDGTVYRITVTSTPIGEEPTLQIHPDRFIDQFGHQTNEFSRVPGIGGPMSREPAVFSNSLPIPTISMVSTSDPTKNLLVISLQPANTGFNDPQFMEVFKGENGTLVLDSVVPVYALLLPQQFLELVDSNTATYTRWVVRCATNDPHRRDGRFSNSIYDTNNIQGDAVPYIGGPITRAPTFSVVSFETIKKSAQDDPPYVGGPISRTPTFSVISFEPIKKFGQEDLPYMGGPLSRKPTMIVSTLPASIPTDVLLPI